MTHHKLKFSENNAKANLDIGKYQQVFHPMIEFLRHHYICPALIMDYDVPMEFIQKAYHSAKYLSNEDKIEFIVQPSANTALTKNLLRKILELPTRSYHEAPTFTQIKEMLKEIGYLEDFSKMRQFRKAKLPGIWNFLFSILNRCITGRSGSMDQGGKHSLSIMWGLVKVKDVDFVDFIWENFVLTVSMKKNFVPYPRFWAAIITKFLGSDVALTGELPPKYTMDRFKMPSNQERWEFIPPIKEEMLAIIPENSPVLKKYRELICQTRIGVIPPSVDLSNMPNKLRRFDEHLYIELDIETDSSSDEVNSVLIQRSTDHCMCSGLLFHNLEVVLGKPDTFTSVSPNLFRYASMGHIHDITLDFDSLITEAKQKKIEHSDVSVTAGRQKRRRGRNVYKRYFRQRENAFFKRDPERQQGGFEGSISRKEFDEMKGNVQELVVSVKDLVQLNLENRKQLKDDIEKSFERIERKRIAEYDSLTKEMKGLKADQTSSTKTLGSAIHMVASKLYDISRKVDALQRATSTAPLTPYPTISAALLSADSIQTQISHILTMLHHILIFLKESKPKDDATTSSTAPSVTEISEAVSKLFDYQTQALKDEYIHFQKEINDLSENVLIQRHAIEKLAMGRQTDAEGIVQVMTQFRDVIIEAHRSFDALNCNAEMLANSWRFGPSSKRDDDPNGEDGKRVSGSSIDELEP